jgi:hypothetical protein
VSAVLGKGFPFITATGCNGCLSLRVSGVGNMELDNGQLVRLRRHEYGCGNRWRSDVMASYGRDTDADEVQRSKELIMMGSKTRKAQCTTLYVCDSNKENLSKSLNRSWAYFLARF